MVVLYNASFFDAFCFGKAKFPAFFKQPYQKH